MNGLDPSSRGTVDGQKRKQQGPCENPLTVQSFANTASTKQAKRKTLQEGPIEIAKMQCRVVLDSARAVGGIARERHFNSVHVQHIPRIAYRRKRIAELFVAGAHSGNSRDSR